MRTLNDELTALFAKETPQYKAEQRKSIQLIKESKTFQRAPKVGDKVITFELPNNQGEMVGLTTFLKEGPVILSFFRGDWCPYCNLELRALQRHLSDFKKFGATLIGISPQTIQVTQMTKEHKELTYTLLSDAGNNVAKEYGLVFKMHSAFEDIHKSFYNINFSDFNLDPSNELPVPATYVIDTEGTIVYAFIEPDYTKRAEPSDIIASLMAIETDLARNNF